MRIDIIFRLYNAGRDRFMKFLDKSPEDKQTEMADECYNDLYWQLEFWDMCC